MRSVNKVVLIGNLTKDPYVKTTKDGKKVVTYVIATNRDWTTNEEKKSLAEFHHIVTWGRLAEICDEYLKKGKLVYIEGYLKTRYWENPEGNRLSQTEIVAYDMIMLNKRGELPEENTVQDFVPSDDSFSPDLDDLSETN